MSDTVLLNTKCGEVLGRRCSEGLIFTGIPFATAERFEKPVPVNHWGGCFDATKPAVEFPQLSTYVDDSHRFYTKEYRSGIEYEYDENLLTLNIIAPENAENCPVLVFIHGGGFFTGKVGEDPAGTSFEYAGRGIILVSIGYRLNVFSLFRSKNLCFYDQVCAIKWIRDNIADYGGDGSRITISGQSAGAISVMDLLFNDQLKGIINGAIMMSGGGFFPKFGNGFTPEESRPFWDLVMKNAGASSDEALKKVPAETLWHSWMDTKAKHNYLRLMNPGPDGVMIPCQPTEIKKSGKMLDVPVMIGVTSQDMIFPLILFNMCVDFCKWSVKRGRKPVYAYYFDRTPPGNSYKAFHGSDLWYFFGNFKHSWRPFGRQDEELKEKMAGSIEKFVKEGCPGWDCFDSKDKKLRYFNTEGEEYIRPYKCYPDLIKYSLFEKGPF